MKHEVDEVVFDSWKAFYEDMERSLEALFDTYDSITTHPIKPGGGENIHRDRYFTRFVQVVVDKPEVRFRRIATVPDKSKLGWIMSSIKTFRDSPNFNLAYCDQIGGYFPLVGVIIFDKSVMYLTTVPDPYSDSIYLRTNCKHCVAFFSRYFDMLWSGDFVTKIKQGRSINEEALTRLHIRLGINGPSVHEQITLWQEQSQTPAKAEKAVRAVRAGQKRKKVVRIGAVQLEMGEDDFEEGPCGLLCKESVVRDKLERILKMADSQELDALCMPEFTMHPAVLPRLRDFARSTETQLVPGTYYDDRRMNVCPVVLSDGQVIGIAKQALSSIELKIDTRKCPIPADQGILVKGTVVGDIGVLICSDLEASIPRNSLLSCRPDVIYVPACNPRSDEFATIMDACIIQQGRENGHAPLLVYCNMLLRRSDGTVAADGKTSFWGYLDRLVIENLQEEGYKPNDSFTWKLAEIEGSGILSIEVNLDDLSRGPGPNRIGRSALTVSQVNILSLD